MKRIRPLFVLLLLTSCFSESDETKIARAQAECDKKTSIDGLDVHFFGYSSNDADSIHVKIKSSNKSIDSFSALITFKIVDSSRQLRTYRIDQEIGIRDTVFLRIKNEPEKKVYNFKYLVRPHFAMFERNWGCDFYELTIDGIIEKGWAVSFIKPGFSILHY